VHSMQGMVWSYTRVGVAGSEGAHLERKAGVMGGDRRELSLTPLFLRLRLGPSVPGLLQQSPGNGTSSARGVRGRSSIVGRSYGDVQREKASPVALDSSDSCFILWMLCVESCTRASQSAKVVKLLSRILPVTFVRAS
jgi:hypothetical protein